MQRPRSAQPATAGKISRLAFELCQRDGIDVLRRLCSDDSLSYPFRLKVVDEAIAVKLITRDELDLAAPGSLRDGPRSEAEAAVEATVPLIPWWRMLARIKARRALAAEERRRGRARRRFEALAAARAIEARAADIRIYSRCTGAEFERLVARAFRSQGFLVEEMGGANDGGVDLHVRRDGRHAIVQCKAHARAIGPAVVRELLGTLRHHHTADLAYLATTNGVTRNAEDWARGKPIKLLVPDDLIRGRLSTGGSMQR